MFSKNFERGQYILGLHEDADGSFVIIHDNGKDMRQWKVTDRTVGVDELLEILGSSIDHSNRLRLVFTALDDRGIGYEYLGWGVEDAGWDHQPY